MKTNQLPKYDLSDNPTNCCPRFLPEPWDQKELHFKNKLFVKAKTISLFHIPLNLSSVFRRTFEKFEQAGALDTDNLVVLSKEISPWSAEHYFSVSKEVPSTDNTLLSGLYLTKVFEGPYKNAPKWSQKMYNFAAESGKMIKQHYFFYTTCPRCAKYYGKNYVVAVCELI